MEIIPDNDEKVIYPKGIPFEKQTVLNLKIRLYADKLKHKLPNELRYMLKGYNHCNAELITWYSDRNNYSHF